MEKPFGKSVGAGPAGMLVPGLRLPLPGSGPWEAFTSPTGGFVCSDGSGSTNLLIMPLMTGGIGRGLLLLGADCGTEGLGRALNPLSLVVGSTLGSILGGAV